MIDSNPITWQFFLTQPKQLLACAEFLRMQCAFVNADSSHSIYYFLHLLPELRLWTVSRLHIALSPSAAMADKCIHITEMQESTWGIPNCDGVSLKLFSARIQCIMCFFPRKHIPSQIEFHILISLQAHRRRLIHQHLQGSHNFKTFSHNFFPEN